MKRESSAYQDLLPELSVYLDWLKMKAKVAVEVIEEYHESLPEEDSLQLRLPRLSQETPHPSWSGW